jgi:hypothetical protein
MEWRRITEEEVYLALENPDKVEQPIRGLMSISLSEKDISR